MGVTPCRPGCHAEVAIPAGKVGQWHIDCLRPSVKAMIYLNDIGEEQAPFRYLKGTHIPDAEIHRQIHRISRSGLDEAYFDAETNALYDAKAEVYARPANTLLLFETRGRHAGSLCADGMRVAMVNGFRPATSLRVSPRFFPFIDQPSLTPIPRYAR